MESGRGDQEHWPAVMLGLPKGRVPQWSPVAETGSTCGAAPAGDHAAGRNGARSWDREHFTMQRHARWAYQEQAAIEPGHGRPGARTAAGRDRGVPDMVAMEPGHGDREHGSRNRIRSGANPMRATTPNRHRGGIPIQLSRYGTARDLGASDPMWRFTAWVLALGQPSYPTMPSAR